MNIESHNLVQKSNKQNMGYHNNKTGNAEIGVCVKK